MLIPPKDLEIINRRLLEFYGNTDDKPNFRLVWSEDLYEKRLTDRTKEGLQLLRPVVIEVPKYRQWVQERYILERLTVISEYQETDLLEKLSYEPLWIFEITEHGVTRAVRPDFRACRFVIENMLEAIRTRGYTKYRDPESTPEEAAEAKEQRLKGMMEDLFGNESAVTDALSTRSGVAYGQGSSPNSSTPMFKGE